MSVRVDWSHASGGAYGIDPDLAAEGGAVSHVDDNGTGGKAYGGYQFNPNFALEGSYVHLGKFSVDGTIPGGTEHAEVRPDCLVRCCSGHPALATKLLAAGQGWGLPLG